MSSTFYLNVPNQNLKISELRNKTDTKAVNELKKKKQSKEKRLHIKYEFHGTFHSVTFMVQVNSHQR